MKPNNRYSFSVPKDNIVVNDFLKNYDGNVSKLITLCIEKYISDPNQNNIHEKLDEILNIIKNTEFNHTKQIEEIDNGIYEIDFTHFDDFDSGDISDLM